MGNCLIRNNQVSAQDDYDYDGEYKVDRKPCQLEVDDQLKKKEEDVKEPADIKMPEENMKKEKKIKKKVRFELEKDDGEKGREEIGVKRRSGSVRIKLVVTQEELRRILVSHENGTQQQKTTFEQLLSSVRSTGSNRSCEVIGEDINDGAINNGWRPTLESIPEDLIQ